MEIFNTPTNVKELKELIDALLDGRYRGARMTAATADKIKDIARDSIGFEGGADGSRMPYFNSTGLFMDDNMLDASIVAYKQDELDAMAQQIKSGKLDTSLKLVEYRTYNLSDKDTVYLVSDVHVTITTLADLINQLNAQLEAANKRNALLNETGHKQYRYAQATKRRVWQGKKQYQVLSRRFASYMREVKKMFYDRYKEELEHTLLVDALNDKIASQKSRIIDMEHINIAIRKELYRILWP